MKHKIKFLLLLAVVFCFGQVTLHAQGKEKQTTTRVPITPAARKQIKNSGLDGQTVILHVGNDRRTTENGECGWSSYGMTLTPFTPKVLEPKGVPGDTFMMTILPPIWREVFPKPDTFFMKMFQLKIEQPKKFGLHIFAEQVIAKDFGPDHHQINKTKWMTTRLGIETSPWGNPWDIKLWGGFYPRKDFKESFSLPTVSANPGPEEAWCDCQVAERSPEFVLGASVSRKIPLFSFLGGEAGLDPTLAFNMPISGNPVPGAKWTVPGAITLGVPLEWQTRLKTPQGKFGGTTAVIGLAPTWQFAQGAHHGFGMEFSAKLSLDTGLFKSSWL